MKKMIMMLAVVLSLVGCAAAKAAATDPATQAEGTYGADLQACTAKSKTKKESKACEAEVDRKWHVDGGAQ